MSHTLTVESALPETRMLFRSSMPDVRDWCPIRVCLHAPVSTSHTRMLVSREPLTTWTPSNCAPCNKETTFYSNPFTLVQCMQVSVVVLLGYPFLRALVTLLVLHACLSTRAVTTCIQAAVTRTTVSLHFCSLLRKCFAITDKRVSLSKTYLTQLQYSEKKICIHY